MGGRRSGVVMAKALYRKYRPKALAEVVGQLQVTEPLSASLGQGKISHAYLFIGPRGTGKTSVARIFAHEVNGFLYEIEDDYVDIIEIDGASNRGIDNIRELREKVAIAPTSGKYKVYIIDEVHMLTKEAFNALLKTLEEPPEHAIFIMATTDAYKVPVTITSRAQTYTFRLADAGVMQAHLRAIADKEKILITDEALSIIVRRGGGSFRDSLSLLDQISTLSETEITKELVERAMGLPEDEKIQGLLDNFLTGEITTIAGGLRELLGSGVKPETVAEELIGRIVAEPKAEYLGLLARLPEVKAPFAEAKLLAILAEKAREGGRINTTNKTVATSGMQTESAMPKMSGKTEPAAEQAPVAPKIACNFDWDGFVSKVKSLNDAISTQLSKCQFAIENGELHLYPDKKITRTILGRENNKRILIEAGGGIKVVVHETGESPAGAKKDELLTKISAIMGGEVQNVGGGNPF